MVVINVTLHPRGLSPEQSAKAWYLRVKEKWKWCDIQKEVVNLKGKPPSETWLRLAVLRMMRKGQAAAPTDNCSNCGRRYGKDTKQPRQSTETEGGGTELFLFVPPCRYNVEGDVGSTRVKTPVPLKHLNIIMPKEEQASLSTDLYHN